MIKFILQKLTRQLIIILLCSITAIIFLSAWYEVGKSINIVIGGLFSLYVPGLFLSRIFFPKQRRWADTDIKINGLDPIERQILNVFLSICATVLALIIARYSKIELNQQKVIAIIFAINLLPAIIYFLTCRHQNETN